MATIRDIARAAGVSQGTVSNVLNGKGNVSSEKILLVERVAQELGHTINQQARTLRKGAPDVLAVMLPDICNRCYQDFFLGFKKYAELNHFSVNLMLSDDIPQKEAEGFEMVRGKMVKGMAVLSCQKFHGRNADKDAQIDPDSVIFVERKPYTDVQYLGFDYRQAGVELAEKIVQHHFKKVAVVTEDLRFYNQSRFYKGFTEYLEDHGVTAEHLTTDLTHCYNHYLEFFEGRKAVDAVVFSDYELSRRYKSVLHTFADFQSPRVYTISPLFTMPEAEDDFYELNYRMMGKQAAESLIDGFAQGKQKETILQNDGLCRWTKGLVPGEGEALTVLTLDSPTAHIMEDMAEMYFRKTGVRVKIAITTYDCISEQLDNIDCLSAYDVIRLDNTWFSGYGKNIFAPLEEIDPTIREMFDGFIPGLIPRFCELEGKIYALPETPSAQMLFYRKDLFENSVLQRLYKEEYKEELVPPTDYRSFNQIARFFTEKYNPSSPTKYGTTLTLGNSGVAATEFLTRYFSYTNRLFDMDGNLLLKTQDAIQALEDLVDVKKYAAPNYYSWWRETARGFAEGDTAMTILFSNYASELLNSDSRVIGNIGFGEVPGNNALIGGGCIGVSKNSRHKEQAAQFIKWICSDKVTSAMTLMGSVSPSKKTYENYEVIDTYPWLSQSPLAIQKSNTIRVPEQKYTEWNERKFLTIVGLAVVVAYNGAMNVEDALALAQEQYESLYR